MAASGRETAGPLDLSATATSREAARKEAARRAAARAQALAPKMEPDPAAIPASGIGVVNIANALTVFRLLLVPVFVVFMFAGGGHDPAWRYAATAVFAIASLTDRIDGEIARRKGLVTDFGKLADPIADKVLVGAALISLSVLDDLPWWVTVVLLGRELGVTGLRLWVIRRGVIPASRGGKIKTFLQGVALGLYILPLTGWAASLRWWVLGVALIVTLATGVDYVLRALALRRATAR
jgi:CDP-diacylglycerol--glycerol-3-phosphate 3-phosphatidyltransferase